MEAAIAHAHALKVQVADLRARFAEFWAHYPRHVAKKAAERAWDKLHPSVTLTDTIVQAIEEQKTWPPWLKDGGAWIPYPASWLNGARWNDERPPPILGDIQVISKTHARLAVATADFLRGES